MIIDSYYSFGHPEGYTDDLGIIADRNQWVPEQLPGWYFIISYSTDIHDWCENNLMGYWKCVGFFSGRRTYYVSSDSDAVLFKMRWS